ncbi:EVE domain-containing protein [Macrococcus sp. DPC7161]|uniref:EVE domain-containing protein n=1 Tax=Macrococcus sp. DPC7161 TaxID=2507060 RepID=UPI00100BB177|nr:EVE domain-containing protein [Macrococcus sp. DPC7161]RXK17623.1 EVE domain-containing protein [Macrococcus sp. DPC7161]
MNYFWLNCGYNRFNHFKDLMYQVSVFDSTVHFNPNEGYQAFKRANVGDKVIFYMVQNKVGLFGAGSVSKIETPKRGQIKIHFTYEEKLMPYTKEYLNRDEDLKDMLFNMKEQLLNPISQEQYEQIVRIGKNEEKINRHFMMREDIAFKPGEDYTIFIRNINGGNRKGIEHYHQMQEGDKVVIYKTNPERGIYGIGSIKRGVHKEGIIPGRTDTEAITLTYIEDVDARTIYELDREPMLRAQYFLNEEWNESVTEITKIQYHAMLHPTEEQVKPTSSIQQTIEAARFKAKKQILPKKETHVSSVTVPKQTNTETQSTPQPSNTSTQEIPTRMNTISPWKLIYVFSLPEHFNGVETAIKYLQLKRSNTNIYTADQNFVTANLYGQYVKEDEHIILHNGIITEALSHMIPKDIIIEDFEHITAGQLKPLIHAASGECVSLPILHEQNRATMGMQDATYTLDRSFKLVAITHLSVEDFKKRYPTYMHPYMKFYAYK